MYKRELDTPVLIVDLDIMENNIRDMASAIADTGAILRPMIKTHKCPAIAHLQLQAPATPGIQTAKLAEAEVEKMNEQELTVMLANLRARFAFSHIADRRKL